MLFRGPFDDPTAKAAVRPAAVQCQESGGRTAICLAEQGDPGRRRVRYVRRAVWSGNCPPADLRRGYFGCWQHRIWSNDVGAGGRGRFHVIRFVTSRANSSCGPVAALGGHRLWYSDGYLRLFTLVPTVGGDAVSDGGAG